MHKLFLLCVLHTYLPLASLTISHFQYHNPYYAFSTTKSPLPPPPTRTQLSSGPHLSRYEVLAKIRCPDDYGRYGTTCLKMSKDFAGYPIAEEKCKAYGGYLASPKNDEVYTAIKQLAEGSRTGSYLVGLRKVNEQWIFGDNTTLGRFAKWAPDQPVNGDDNDCVVMSRRFDHMWFTTGCKWAWRYICQYDLEKDAEPSLPELGCKKDDLNNYKVHPTHPYKHGYYGVGTAISVECSAGFGTKKPILAECGNKGKWYIDKSCIPLCPTRGLTTSLQHANATIPKNFLAGDIITYKCAKDHVLLGNSTSQCLQNHSWSTPMPQCVKKPEQVPRTQECPSESQVFPTPSPRHPPKPDIEFLKVGQSVILSCLQHYHIEPRSIHADAKEWTWMKDQEILKVANNTKYPDLKIDEEGSLLILNMSPALEGLYTCVSFVAEEREVSVRSVHVVLRRKCEINFQIKPQDIIVYEGGYTILRCYAANASISWAKGIMPIVDDATHHILLNGALLIKNARIQDTGTYTCMAEELSTKCQISHSVSVEVSSSVNVMCGKPAESLGKSQEDDLGKIVGGEEAEKGSHPWLALIVGDIPISGRSGTNKVFCGGSLVNNYWVISAAHCFRVIKNQEDFSYIKVKLGKHNRIMKERDERIYSVQEGIVHPQFDRNTFDNDIALLRLSDRVYYSNYILPICLPTYNIMDKYYPVNKTQASGTVAGWGRLAESGRQPEELRKVSLPLIDKDTCKRSTSAVMTENMFCAGYKLSTGDACKGDSGGAFELNEKGKSYLVGIVSWGEGCARPAKYGFYTKVDNYLHFIEQHINNP